MKYYCVRVGRNPGIYSNWEDCKKEVNGFPKAEYKKFENKEEALNYMNMSNKDTKSKVNINDIKKDEAIAYVDGSFNIRDFSYSYGIVFINSEGETYFNKAFEKDEYSEMRNVAGEINGSMEAIKLAISRNLKKISIFYDYMGIEKWATGDWKANKKGTIEYKKFIEESKKLIEINFIKVEAHTGDKYNEMADKLAKEALGIK